ncbi:hypothetical protein KAF81_32170 [Pseudomonas aeruginosa]|uniref:F-box protein n=2 Tax=Pseudomonadota TaxID=1224 RepID=UPI001B380B35|nr:F-box protein [Pseudomonas aeruginosa]MBP8322303.1 hypothetical protein [Pseudomonas aeruginosa]
MIEAAKSIGMSNGFRVEINTQKSLKNTSAFSSSLINVCSLPAELKREIAFYLDSRSYANLRLTCKAMSEDLESVSVMRARLKQGLSGDLAKDYRKIVRDHLIKKVLNGDQTKEIELALKNCFARPHRTYRNCTAVGTEYLPDKYEKNTHPTPVEKAINLCSEGITSFIPSMSNSSFIPDIFPGKLWKNSINLGDSKINKNTLKDIFSSFNETHHRIQGTEKHVVAHLAHKLRNYWMEKPPSAMTKKDVINYCAAYPELFRAGDDVEELVELGFGSSQPDTSSSSD